jgi:hypothetical protein
MNHTAKWDSMPPADRAQLEAAIKVASNFYLITTGQKLALWMDTKDAPTFSLPDSRYRYIILCFSALIAACGEKMAGVVAREFQAFLMVYCRDNSQEFFGGPANELDTANSGAQFFQKFLNTWSRYNELENKLAAMAEEAAKLSNAARPEFIRAQFELISAMIHETESETPLTAADVSRLSKLSLHFACVMPTMRDAFFELISLSPDELNEKQAEEKEMRAKVDSAFAAAQKDPGKLPEFQATLEAALEKRGTEPTTTHKGTLTKVFDRLRYWLVRRVG